MPAGTPKVALFGGKVLTPGGTQTFNSPGTFTVPTGITSVNITGKGSPGNPGNAGNPALNTPICYPLTSTGPGLGAGGGGGGSFFQRLGCGPGCAYTPVPYQQNYAPENGPTTWGLGGSNLSNNSIGAIAGGGATVTTYSYGNTGQAGVTGTPGNPGSGGSSGNASTGLSRTFPGGAAGNGGAGGNAGTGGNGGTGGGYSLRKLSWVLAGYYFCCSNYYPEPYGTFSYNCNDSPVMYSSGGVGGNGGGNAHPTYRRGGGGAGTDNDGQPGLYCPGFGGNIGGGRGGFAPFVAGSSYYRRAGGGGGGGISAYAIGAGGGGRGNLGNAGSPGNAGGTANPSTFNSVSVTAGASYPISVASPGGQVVISWNPQ